MTMFRIGLAAAALATAGGLSVSGAFADEYRGGSFKDTPVVMTSPHRCYFRGDVGYSWSRDPDTRFTQTAASIFQTESASASFDNTWLVGGGFGCGSTSRGIRGELMVDWRGDRDLTGTLALPSGANFSTSVKSLTVMFNGYYDLGNVGGFVPYVGAGVGAAHNDVGRVTFTGDPGLANPLNGDDKWSLAWSLMAGVGYQISDRITLDIGYRYIDLGKVQSSRVDSTGYSLNPHFRLDDLTAHEFKVGLRFAFGGGEACCSVMK
jgi:opacity protein-like surface antigen